MSVKVNFLRQFSDSYQGIKTINDVELIPLFESLEDTILRSEYTTTSAEAVKFFYTNTHLTDKAMGEIYYDVLPKPTNVKGVGDTMRPQSVRYKRKAISDDLYRVFGDDFFTVLLSDKNYAEVNWRRNIINHKLGETSRLFSTEAITALRSLIDRTNSVKQIKDSSNFTTQNDGEFVVDSVGFNQAIDSVFSLSDCDKEIEFLYRYLNPELALADQKLNANKVSFLLSIMAGEMDKESPGIKLSMLGEILGHTRLFTRP